MKNLTARKFDTDPLTSINFRQSTHRDILLKLTKLDQTKILLNLETIKFIEAVPDTVITFTNGETIIVRETISDIEAKFMQLKSRIITNTSQYKTEEA